jgi:hypothetical protein
MFVCRDHDSSFVHTHCWIFSTLACSMRFNFLLLYKGWKDVATQKLDHASSK